MHLIRLMVNYLYRKYGVPINSFTRKWQAVQATLRLFATILGKLL